MTGKFAVVELNDGTVTSVSLDKFLASSMTIIEECDQECLAEKTAYWDRVYHYRTPGPDEETGPRYHYYDKRRKRHLYTDEPEKSRLRGVRRRNGYERVAT